jgi:hypothetical protein
MTTTPAILVLLATLALGFVAGALHLQKLHKPAVVRAHLVAALAALGVVALTILTAPRPTAGPSGWLVLALLGLAVGVGYGTFRLRAVGRGGRQAMLIGHLAMGIASFFVFLAWAKTL